MNADTRADELAALDQGLRVDKHAALKCRSSGLAGGINSRAE